MKFGTLLELNSNIEWWNYYVDYDALKKLFPSSPLDPSYHSTSQESSSLLPIASARPADKYASPEEFRIALDREREKVADFYKGKYKELAETYQVLLSEITAIEDRELGGDDVIKEENEEEADGSDDEGDGLNGESDVLLRRSSHSNFPGQGSAANRPLMQKRASIMHRLGAGWKSRRRGSALPTSTHEADLMEASVASLQTRRSSNDGGARRLSQSADEAMLSPSSEMPPSATSNASPVSPARRKTSTRRHRASSDLGSSDLERERDRRTSMSSTSSHEQERDFVLPRSRWQSLELVEMDAGDVPDFSVSPAAGMANRAARGNGDAEMGDIQEEGEGEGEAGGDRPVYVWTGSNDHATVLRIGFKKRVSANWLEAYALKQYVDLNLTAFEKILKKYDKNTNSKLKKDYVANTVLPSCPWSADDRASLDSLLDRIIFLYRRVVTSGDEDLAKDQLRSQLREKVVVDRETVWSQMVSGHREGIFRSVTPEFPASRGKLVKTPLGRIRVPEWLSAKGVIFALAVAVLVGIVVVQPMKRVEESNCLAMLVFCTILWATEAIPLFVTSLSVPLLVVVLRVIRSTPASSAEEAHRLSASEATKFIFSQMFNPTIMLLIGGFTIAAVLSKTRLDIMTASRILNAAGTNPSVVLLVLMSVATFASMWISNVAAPTLCYALIKPITNELHPKSVFSKALIIAIALAANIGGQASPISSPQNLIALGEMTPPLSWLQWFAISIPVSSLSVVAIWAFLHVNYRWESDLRIPRMRKNTDTLTKTHYFVLLVSGVTIGLWCVEKSFEGVVGDMGVIAIIPLLAFFGTGILSKEDFHSFHWSIVFLAMGGIALGKATLSSGLLDELDQVLERLVEGMGLYSILLIFSALALVIATFISHTIAAVLLVPIATRIGESLEEPHPRLLIMATALICSAGMGLPVSGFPNMTAITQENKLGQRFIGASDFLKNGIPASVLATGVIVSVGYAIMQALGL